MHFTVVDQPRWRPSQDAPGAFLVYDTWDDYGFKTVFNLWCSNGSEQREIGFVRIGHFGMVSGRTPLPRTFTRLGNEYFSLGLEDVFYVNLTRMEDQIREALLIALRDVAADLDLFAQARQEAVMRTSLLRNTPDATVITQFHRIADGGARLTKFQAFYIRDPTSVPTGEQPLRLTFGVDPESLPPTNVHVLIGRNGVGKSHVLHAMARALTDGWESRDMFSTGPIGEDTPGFANLVVVSFSAFDRFPTHSRASDRGTTELTESLDRVSFEYVGLKRSDSDAPMTTDQLADAFTASAEECRVGPLNRRWRRALAALESDPIFHHVGLELLAPVESGQQTNPREVFQNLSSGHKIVLLTVTRLVECVTERSLILIDEPESHLHPPLLSSFIRALSDLLADRNGMAVIATHSPVILQEVPRECVWVLRRHGDRQVAERPELETFGENVGVLTREAFGLEVTRSGFHRLVTAAVEEGGTYQQILDRFDGKLGAEARALARATVAIRDAAAGR